MEFPQHDRRRRIPRPAPAGAHRMHELLDLGWEEADVRRSLDYSTLQRVDHGIYGPLTTEVEARSLTLLQALSASGDQVASHTTAAALLGVPGFRLIPPLHITSPVAGGRIRRRQVRAHRSDVPEEDITVLGGVRLTRPGRTWVDLALGRTLTDAVILADRMLRPPRHEFGEHGDAVMRWEEMRAAVARRRGSRGIRRVRLAADLARVGADSPQETRLRLAMWRDGLPEPRVNPQILDEAGRVVLEPDLAIDEYRIAIEYDGVEVHSEPGQVLRDVRRADRAEAMGWWELRITKDHSREQWRPGLLKIRRALRARGWVDS
ncbi:MULTISPECIES: hypothetical protein [Actinomycetes]|uniref:Transcriptional regulator, AbiEi antitoxin, Type IV TA system n=2 Tax=Actinomycetes TaxID=1760 RepID=A0ABP6LXM9_9MICC